MRIHANDGINADAKTRLQEEGFTVTTDHVPQEQLIAFINAEKVDVLLVRSATKARKELIDACPGLKLIGRGGVGLDNIDVAHAKTKGIPVINTPASSSISVAELVMAHLFGLMRNLHESNRTMPVDGRTKFKDLKKAYEKGTEVRGKTIGIIGFGRIGQWTARYALGCGMRVIYVDNSAVAEAIELEINGQTVRVGVKMVTMEELLAQADAISVHVPGQKDGQPVLSAEHLAQVKPGVVIVNTARGGSIDEDALLAALKSGRVKGAALDVFTNEPEPRADLLTEPKLSLSPHIGAATAEAQGRVGEELADLIISWRDSVQVNS
ncbi:MAG: 3-phosphoglycerate dehydrogenase [Flavobacteriales bacterium]|nr:3-phosphoglycerate dehydrogenase [Flavobacteriales bacterium]MBL0035697.1 3-phosphoglycerate dehydrogenase [Flavobacteriales bacterium]